MPKTWLITGATSGLGLERAQQLLAEGHTVIATARRPEALSQLKQHHPAFLHVIELDPLAPDNIKHPTLNRVEQSCRTSKTLRQRSS